MLIFLMLLNYLLPVALPKPPQKASLTVEVNHIESLTGQVMIGVFRSCTGFPTKCRPVVHRSIGASQKSVKTVFEIEPGEYAVAIYHDLNGDEKLNTNMLGFPKEPYGFSNNYRPHLTAPKFSDCQVQVGQEGKLVQVRLE